NYFVIRSEDGPDINAIHLYNDQQENTASYFQIDEPLIESSSYQIVSGNLTDNAENMIRITDLLFDGTVQSDTTSLRYIGAINTADLVSTDTLKIRYSKIIDTSILQDSIKIYVNRNDAKSQFEINVLNNLLLINPVDGWSQSDTYE